jgi:hypothetical protein
MLFILIIILGGISSMFGHWWIIVPICMILNYYFAKSSKEAFAISSAAVITLWVGYATYLHLTADVDLVEKIAGIFSSSIPALGKIPAAGLVFSIISLIAGLIGGFGGLSGYSLKSLELTA